MLLPFKAKPAFDRRRSLQNLFFEVEERAFFDRVRAAYRQFAEAEPGRVQLIDGSQAPGIVKAEIEKIIISI